MSNGYPYETLGFEDEHTLFSYLDEYLNANGQRAQIAGVDADDNPFFAYLIELGGDETHLFTTHMVETDNGANDTIRGGKLAYPVVTLVRL